MAITPEQYRMTQEEMMGGAGGQTAYTKRIASLRAADKDPLEDTGELKIPDPVVEQKDLTDANGYLARLKQESEDEAARLKKEADDRAAANKKAAEEKRSWYDKAFPETREEKRESEYEELGVDPTEYIAEKKADIAELEGLWTSYNDKEAQRDAAVATQQGRPGADIAFQNREVQNINNKYNVELNRMAAKINTKSAIMAQKQGLMNEAKAFAKEAVDDYTYDMQIAYEQLEQFEEENRLELEDIEQEYKDQLAETKAIDYEIWQETKKEKTSVMDLMLQSPQAGISLDDTLEEAVQKAAKWAGSQTQAGDSPQVFGTEDTGYYEQVYNEETGQWEYKSTGVGGGGGGPSGSTVPGLTEKEAEKFEVEINIGTNALSLGKPWGPVWDRIHRIFPNVPNEFINNALGGGQVPGTDEYWGWAKEGAFEGAGISNSNIAN